MPYYYFQAQIADIALTYALRYQKTAEHLGHYIQRELLEAQEPISVKDYEFEDWKNLGNEVNPHGEYSLLSLQTSEALFEHQRFIFHAVAFRWKDKSWLLTAAPGVGKSTQYKNLKELYPEEISIINGDRPVLQILDEGSIMVHPSPWNGKENWCGAEAAPLAGIIFLKHGENTIEPVEPKTVASRTFFSIFQSFDTGEGIKKTAKLAQQLLKSAPLWLLTNRGDLASSALIYDVMK